MSGPATGNKVCIICGTDCSRLPRVKDTNGKYYCRDCYYAAKQKKAASRSATNVMDDASGATLPAAPRRPAPAPVSIDDAIPMLFRMGADDAAVRRQMDSGADFALPVCRHSVGLTTDEPAPRFPLRRRVYLFAPTAWTAPHLNATLKLLRLTP